MVPGNGYTPGFGGGGGPPAPAPAPAPTPAPYVAQAVLPIPNYAPEDITIVGTKAYLAADPNGVTIVDISNPLSPSIVGGYNNDGSHGYYQVAVVGNTMYAPCHGTNDFDVVDVSNPA